MDPRKFCTCSETTCPMHPTNHEHGCDLCIQKNLKLGEIPSCFFNEVGNADELDSFFYRDFARVVMEHEAKLASQATEKSAE